MLKKKNRVNLLIAVISIGVLAISISLTIRLYTSKNQNISFETYIVEPGDTLWSIAREFKESGQDIRELIYEIRKVNKLDSAIILPNQELKIPVKEE